MNIQWFPGHMTKALRELESNLKKVDAVIYVLDARAPLSTLNPEISKIVSNKPIIYVLNKADMADRVQTEKWVKYMSKFGIAMAIEATKGNIKKLITDAIKKSLSDKINKNKQKGFNVTLRACVVGVPNTGKSTLINVLARAVLSKTGNIAGVTRSASWRKIEDGLELMDTAGTLWPKFDDQEIANNLAFIGSVSDNVVDISSLALSLIKKLKKIAPSELQKRYKIEDIKKDDLVIFEEICKTRGFLFKKNEFDYERCGRAIIDDFRKCRIGKITLDRIEDLV